MSELKEVLRRRALPVSFFRTMLVFILFILFLCIVALPLFVEKVEHNLELFLFCSAVIAVTSSHFFGDAPAWTLKLVESALTEPLKITLATFVFGLIFRALREPLKRKIVLIEKAAGPRLFAAVVIFSLGMLSSVITAIIAALILCEIVTALSLDKKYETIFAVLCCFSIGLGAVLTPIGEPLSTIAVAKLRGSAYSTDSVFLLKLLGIYIIPGLVAISAVGGFLRGREVSSYESLSEDYAESVSAITVRAAKVYFFVMALILLGEGFRPVIDRFIAPLSAGVLYWLNISSAVLDNATLAAAELDPKMSVEQIRGILMGLTIAGGMLVPGNIPNIIAASKLRIPSRTWAVIGVPMGLVLMSVYFEILFFLRI